MELSHSENDAYDAMLRGEYDLSFRLYENIDDINLGLLNNKGCLLLLMGEYSQALTIFMSTRDVFFGDRVTNEFIGVALCMLNEKKKAISFWKNQCEEIINGKITHYDSCGGIHGACIAYILCNSLDSEDKRYFDDYISNRMKNKSRDDVFLNNIGELITEGKQESEIILEIDKSKLSDRRKKIFKTLLLFYTRYKKHGELSVIKKYSIIDNNIKIKPEYYMVDCI